ncbi:M4 family metallopeptidase [Seinonella peptonophila]
MVAIYYCALNFYLSNSSNFAQMRIAAAQSAIDLYGCQLT